ncbi:TPA: hypothetical protein PXP01_001325 [Yersinia enterocolitica]|nr:hypothetical protein [Yersinia enterocolitica]
MKELDSFTVERLEELSTKENIPEVAALARIALAAKRAKPVAYGTLQKEFCDEERSLFTDKDSASKYSESCYDLTPLYTTLQLNSPEIPEGWKGTLETAAKLIDLCRTYTILGDTGSYKERTINDCELTMQEIESYLASAPEKENG